MRSSVEKLDTLEKGKGKSSSILHKTNKIADLFRSIVSPIYEDLREWQIQQARADLETLAAKLDTEIANAEAAKMMKSCKT